MYLNSVLILLILLLLLLMELYCINHTPFYIQCNINMLYILFVIVHEKVDSLTERLELVMNERATSMESSHPLLTSSTGSTPSVLLPATELHSTTPLRKFKSCKFCPSFIHPSIHPSIHSYMHPSSYSFIHLFIHLLINPSIHSLIHASI